MIILRAIGRFFAKIGRWIRDTAWVQPLLIVGGIFAVIFSIPYLTNWVKGWFDEGTAYINYYKKSQLSIKNCDDKTSEADGILQYLVDVDNGEATQKQKDKYGTKFFLAFVQDGCSGCESNYYGLNYLQKNYTTKNDKSTFYLGDDAFKIHSIFMDESDEDIKNVDNIFDHYLYENYSQIFEFASEYATDVENYSYLINQGGQGSSYYTTAESISTEMQSPTIFLVDIGGENEDRFGISEVLFNYSGRDGDNSTYGKALTLVDAWNHTGIFSEDYVK